jgi:hypothetical protein
MIIVASPDKPFKYTAKGTLQRAAIVEDYDYEIRALYSSLENISGGEITPPEMWTAVTALNYIRAIVHSIMKCPVGDNDDIFHFGCDRSFLSYSDVISEIYGVL